MARTRMPILGHILLLVSLVVVLVLLAVYKLLAFAAMGILGAGATIIFLFGLITLPKKAGLREWRRTLGLWAVSCACVLFAVCVWYFQQPIDPLAPTLFWIAGFLALLLGVALLYHEWAR